MHTSTRESVCACCLADPECCLGGHITLLVQVQLHLPQSGYSCFMLELIGSSKQILNAYVGQHLSQVQPE